MAHSLVREASEIRIHTRAEGFLSPLAHDLELSATPSELANDDTLVIAAAAVRVVGVLKKGRVDDGVLSVGDKFEIDRRVREELLVGDVTVKATRSGNDLDVVVSTKRGSETKRLSASVTTRDDRIDVKGELVLSMKKLGIGPVKGPMGVFRVKDDVTVLFNLRFTR